MCFQFRPPVQACVLVSLLATVTLVLLGDPQQQNRSGSVNPGALKKLSIEDLSQIEVTSPSKTPQEAFRSPVAIFVITGEQIRRSGAQSIPEALRLAPGVEVARIDGNKWSIGIRGFGSRLSRSVLVIIDGRTVYTTLYDGTYWEVQDTVMDDIDRIEVIRGPGGTIWGPNAVNGVINIITKDSGETAGLLASAGGGNEEQGFVNLRYGGSDGPHLHYRVYAKGFSRSPEDHSDHQNFDDWRAAQTGFRIDWKPDEKNALTVQGDLYDERAGESVQAVSYTQPYSVIADANARLSGGNVSTRWSKVLSEGNDIQIQAYYDRTNRNEPNFGDLRSTYDVDYLQRLRLAARQRLSWGLGARFSVGNEIPVVSGLTFTPSKRTDELYTAFLQDEVNLIDDRLSLTLGTKFLRANYTNIEFEPSARLAWTPSANQTFWAAFTHAVRTPSDVEEDFSLSGYITTTPSGVPYFARFIANPNFAPEQLNGYELGHRRLLAKKVYLDAAAFYNHYHDLFSEDIIGAPFLETDPAPLHYLLPAQFRNGLLGNTKGVEIAAEWGPQSFWRLRGSYSYLHMNLARSPHSGDVGTAPVIEGASPQHQAAIQAAFDVSSKLQLDLDYRFISALPSQLVPGYSTANARLAWRFNRQVEFSLVGQNLFQPSHFEDAGDPGPLVGIKRSAYLQVRWMQ